MIRISAKLLNDIIYILQYFKDGLEEIKVASGEEQPLLPEIKKILKTLDRIKKATEL